MMKYVKKYLRGRVWAAILLGLWAAIFAAVLFFYRLPVEAVGYAAMLCLVLLILWAAVDVTRFLRKVRRLEEIAGQAELALDQLPEPEGLLEEQYQELLRELEEKLRGAVSAADARQRETLDYYTLWVHQIKTPIAAMRLMLQGDESRRGRELSAELFRVEQYVELVLSYLRLGSESTDYVICRWELSEILRRAVRKYAPLFIRSRVSLDLEDTDLAVLTDGKWLQLVVEQILSNAVKYAPGGKVTIQVRGEKLIIQDNGVGIRQEDLPRVFDRSFTGCNGRGEERSTGIGLYLCRQICQRLGHSISLDAEPGKGTRVTIGLSRPELEVE